MKHLKSFEKVKEEEDIEIDNNNNIDLSKITKYFVWIYHTDTDHTYHILSIVNDKGYAIISTDKNEVLASGHLYYKNGKFIDNNNGNNSTYIDINSSNILLRSNDLEECKEFIESTTSQNKYNL